MYLEDNIFQFIVFGLLVYWLIGLPVIFLINQLTI